MTRRTTPAGITRAEALTLLASVPLFRGLTADELVEMFQGVQHEEILPRTTFHDPAEGEEILYVLKRGRVHLYRLTSSGKKIILMDLKPPTVFGSMGIFGQRLEGEFAETAEKSLICRVSRPALERVLRRQPDVALRLLDLLGRRLGEVERRVEEMAALTAEQRLAAFLLRLTETSGGILAGFTQDELAEVSGTVRQTVARILGKWRRKGIVTVRRRSVHILRRDILIGMALS